MRHPNAPKGATCDRGTPRGIELLGGALDTQIAQSDKPHQDGPRGIGKPSWVNLGRTAPSFDDLPLAAWPQALDALAAVDKRIIAAARRELEAGRAPDAAALDRLVDRFLAAQGRAARRASRDGGRK
jgi:hypothetical protein